MSGQVASEGRSRPRGGRSCPVWPRRRGGLAGKLFAGALAVSFPPLALALAASVAVYLGQSTLVGAEIVEEKARSARFILDERLDRLERFVERVSRESSLVVNLDLGLDQARDRYLAGLAAAERLGRLAVEIGPDAPALAYGPEADGVSTATIETGSVGPEMVLRRRVLSADGRALGILAAALPLRGVAIEVAKELGAVVLVVDAEGGLLLAEGPPESRDRGAAPSTPLEASIRFPEAWTRDSGSRPAFATGPGRFRGRAALFAASALPLDGAGLNIAVAYPLDALERIYGQGIAALGLAVAAALLLAGLVTVYFIRTIARPASALAATARSIAEGRYGLATGIVLMDEIGDIAHELDALSSALLAQKEERDVAEESLRQGELQFRSIFDGVDDAIFVYDPATGLPTDANAAAAGLFGLDKARLVGRPPEAGSDEPSGYDRARFADLLRKAAAGETMRVEWRSRHSGGRVFWTELVLRSARIGSEDRVLAVFRDIDARKADEAEKAKSLREKENLLREVHHRVKNNFQIINSLFSLQESAIQDERLAAAAREPRERIHAMAMIHDRLYRSEDLESIDFGAYVVDLAEELFLAYVPDRGRVALELRTEPLRIHIDRAIPCGLVLNELLTNALKYAFPPSADRKGTLTVELSSGGGEALLVVADDGVGIPAERLSGGSSTLGLTLARALALQLSGSLSIDGSAGTRAELRLPLAP